MTATNKNLLIVEGKGEQYTIPELMDFHTVWGDKPKDWVVEIKEMNGVQPILKDGTLSAASKISGLRALGVIVDADDDFSSRWERLRKICCEFAGDVPDHLPGNGLIHLSPTGLRVGVWIMPDNSSRGMMETFLARLLSPDCSSIWEKAQASCEEVGNYAQAHNPVHRDKAKIHTYLAWVDPPGRTLPEAIIAKAIDAKLPLADQFVSWIMTLFELTPRAV